MSSELDLVYKAYTGELGKKRQQDVKSRIDWIVGNVNGDNVIDVGCSQGVASIILASKGKRVLGVDIENDSIEFAKGVLSTEDEKTKENLNFVVGDFYTMDFEEQKFDVVLITEVLEHLTAPTDFLDKAKKILNVDGQLIVTVPFGINRSPGHLRTYYFAELYAQISKLFLIEKYEILGNWIGYICKNVENPISDNISVETLKDIEKGFYEIENDLREKSISRASRITRLLDSNDAKAKRIEKFTHRINKKDEDYSKKEETYKNREESYKKEIETLKCYESELRSEVAEKSEFVNSLNLKINEQRALINRYESISNPIVRKMKIVYWKLRNYIKNGKKKKKQIKTPKLAKSETNKVLPNIEKTLEAVTVQDNRVKTILFMATNGAGLGHITRALAVAKRIRDSETNINIVFIATSIALNIVRKEGFSCYHIPSRELLKDSVDAKQWGIMLNTTLNNLLNIYNVKTVVFDGAFPYAQFVNTVSKNKNCTKIWIKRGGEKQEVADARKQKEKDFDYIVIPNELDNQDLLSEGKHFYVPPIVFLDKKDLVPKDNVRKFFKVDKDKKIVYVQLGAGNINDIDSLSGMVISAIRKRADVAIVLGESIIGNSLNLYEDDIYVLQDYPNSKYLDGIDFAISACGYNSFYENIYFGVPTIFIPNIQTKSDDQLKRAMIAEELGCGMVLKEISQDSIDLAIDQMLENCEMMRSKSLNTNIENGALSAAEFIINKTLGV